MVVRTQWLLLMTVALYLWAFAATPEKALAALQVGADTFVSVLLLVAAVMGLSGLIQAWISREAVSRLLGHEGGIRALLIAVLCGMVLIGPAYILFPLLMSIRRQGARWAVIGTVLAAYAIKIPMVPLEFSFLGWKFSLLRSLLTLFTAIPIGLAVERIMERSGQGAGLR